MLEHLEISSNFFCGEDSLGHPLFNRHLSKMNMYQDIQVVNFFVNHPSYLFFLKMSYKLPFSCFLSWIFFTFATAPHPLPPPGAENLFPPRTYLGFIDPPKDRILPPTETADPCPCVPAFRPLCITRFLDNGQDFVSIDRPGLPGQGQRPGRRPGEQETPLPLDSVVRSGKRRRERRRQTRRPRGRDLVLSSLQGWDAGQQGQENGRHAGGAGGHSGTWTTVAGQRWRTQGWYNCGRAGDARDIHLSKALRQRAAWIRHQLVSLPPTRLGCPSQRLQGLGKAQATAREPAASARPPGDGNVLVGDPTAATGVWTPRRRLRTGPVHVRYLPASAAAVEPSGRQPPRRIHPVLRRDPAASVGVGLAGSSRRRWRPRRRAYPPYLTQESADAIGTVPWIGRQICQGALDCGKVILVRYSITHGHHLRLKGGGRI